MNPAARIDRLLKGTPMQGLGASIVAAGRKNGVSPFLITAIAGAESHFGQFAHGHNPFGWGPGIHFGSWNDAISTVAHGLRTSYLDEGRKTVQQIGEKWAPKGAGNDPTNLNSNWTKNVSMFMRKLGSSGGPGLASSTPLPPRGANMSSGMAGTGNGLTAPPDPTGAALQSLSEIASGQTVTPERSLDNLVQSLAASGGSSVGAPAPTRSSGGQPTPAAVRGPGITYHGQHLTHQTAGLPGYPAVDIFAKPGTPFRAPEAGKVIRYQTTGGGTSGQVFGYGLYFQGVSGKTYFITHLQKQRPRIGATVRKGGVLGRVSPWQDGPSHAHVGIHG